MPYDEALADRVRRALRGAGPLEEKRMFGGLTFMVRRKMCVSVGKDRLMCRIDPAIHDLVVKRKGCRTVRMKGREYRGFVYVDAAAVKSESALDEWVRLALDFNRKAKPSLQKPKR